MEERVNLPNALTLSRMLAIVPICSLWASGRPGTAATLAFLAGATDFIDGKLARATGTTTAFGALLDPIADKLLITSLFGVLAHAGALPRWLFWLALFRNVSQLLCLPILLWWKRRTFHVRPTLLPKFASGLCYALIVVGLLKESWSPMVSDWLVPAACYLSAAIEIQIVVTYWPRLWQIARGTHDTFE